MSFKRNKTYLTIRRKVLSFLIIAAMIFSLAPSAIFAAADQPLGTASAGGGGGGGGGVVVTFAAAFPDAKFRAEVLALLNKKDGGARADGDAITEADIATLASIETLDVSNKAIADLTGISYFLGLKILKCNNNELTSLDLAANMVLNELQCIGNKLMNVDNLSMNPALEWLDCNDNKLTAINLEGFDSLLGLWCNMNEIAALDLTPAKSLEWVSCNLNGMTSIKVSGLNNLLHLGCGSNNLTNLDLTGLSSLKALYCDNNKFTSLNLYGLSNLELVWCQNNLLTGLDVSSLTQITELFCWGNYIPSPDKVIGWQSNGKLEINDPINPGYWSYTKNFMFYNQNAAPQNIVTISGIDVPICIVNGVAVIELDKNLLTRIVDAGDSVITVDLAEFDVVDFVMSDVSMLKGNGKSFSFITSKGVFNVKTQTLWNNSGKTRVVEIRKSANVTNR